jgi:type IV pilus assembly protein PilO
MSMTRKWSLLTVVLILAILAASWFLLVAPKRSEAADLKLQSTAQNASNAALVQKLNELKAQAVDLPKQKAQLAVLRKQIPDNPALPTLVRALTAASKKVGVTIVSMKPGTPTASTVAATAPVAPPSATDTSSTDSAASDASGTTATPVAPTPAAATLYLLPVNLEVTGTYFEMEQFVNKLEGMQRTFLVNSFDLKSGATPGSTTSPTATADTSDQLTLILDGRVFLSPPVAATATSTTATAPATAQAQ